MVSIPHRQAQNIIDEPIRIRVRLEFQSLIGRLKTETTRDFILGFQQKSFNPSQVGSKLFESKDEKGNVIRFQSLIGRLKTLSRIVKIPSFSKVSIPHRQAQNPFYHYFSTDSNFQRTLIFSSFYYYNFRILSLSIKFLFFIFYFSSFPSKFYIIYH